MPSRYNYIEYYLARRFFSGQKFAPSVAVSPQNHAFRPEDAFGAARRRALRYARKHQPPCDSWRCCGVAAIREPVMARTAAVPRCIRADVTWHRRAMRLTVASVPPPFLIVAGPS